MRNYSLRSRLPTDSYIRLQKGADRPEGMSKSREMSTAKEKGKKEKLGLKEPLKNLIRSHKHPISGSNASIMCLKAVLAKSVLAMRKQIAGHLGPVHSTDPRQIFGDAFLAPAK